MTYRNYPYTTPTWLQPESLAYNTYAGGHSRSARKGRAMCADGVLRIVTAGVADSFFSVPAHTRINGRYASGFLMWDDSVLVFVEVPRVTAGVTDESDVTSAKARLAHLRGEVTARLRGDA